MWDIIFAQMEFSRSLVRSFSSWATISKSSQKEEIWCICVPQLGLIFTTSARGDSICGIGLPSLLPKLIRETTTKTTCIKGLAYEQNRLLLHF